MASWPQIKLRTWHIPDRSGDAELSSSVERIRKSELFFAARLLRKWVPMTTNQRIIRVITRASDGSIREKDFESFDSITELYDQVGIDDCSTDLELRGMPIFRGLVGPLPDGKTVVRYESPDIFEALTKEWTLQKTKRRRRRRSGTTEATAAATIPGSMPISTTMPSVS